MNRFGMTLNKVKKKITTILVKSVQDREPRNAMNKVFTDAESFDGVVKPVTLEQLEEENKTMNHTPENYPYDTSKYTTIKDPEKHRRLVCEKACDGIPTEALEAGVIQEAKDAIRALSKWVGKGIADGAYDNCVGGHTAKIHLDNASRTLAKLEGKQQC